MAEDLGLGARAGAGPGGEVRAGSLAKALEILRALKDEMGSAAHLVDHLGQLVRGEEKHDGISARSKERPFVRIMNLHKAKGLEAPVVFLAAPYGKSEHDVKLHIDRERSEVLGFMAVLGSAPEGRSAPCLALPLDWESHTRVEKAFQDAENLRLLYVAATRAGSHLVVSRREGAPGKLRYNPWAHFVPHLESCEALPVPDPGGISVAEPDSARLSAQRVDRAMDQMKRALAQVMKPTYGSMPAKEYAFSLEADSGTAPKSEAFAPLDVDALNDPEGEHGVEWGTVIHALLQLAMTNPKADLFRAAEAQLAENGLDESMAEAAVDTVQRVRSSRLWKRAQKSELYFTEVPFQVSWEDKGRDPDAGPLVLRGVVDLAFKEGGAWVIVDYKTDSGRGKRAEKYERQVRLYADAWAKCTEEPVKERGLFFIQTGNYRKV
jgi:ATP-dependent helicase/nuclease subunit A